MRDASEGNEGRAIKVVRLSRGVKFIVEEGKKEKRSISCGSKERGE